MIDFDEIKKEVAIRHNVLLTNDDPVLVTVTINELVLDQYLSLVAKRYDDSNKDLCINLQHHIEQSKETAGKIITDASNYVSEQVRQSISSEMKSMTDEFLTQIQKMTVLQKKNLAYLAEINSSKKTVFVATAVAAFSAVIAIGVLVMTVIQ